MGGNKRKVMVIGSSIALFILALAAFYPRAPVGEPHVPAGISANPATGHMILADSADHAIFVIDKNNREILKKVILAEHNDSLSFGGPEMVVHSSKYLYATDVPFQGISVLDDHDYNIIKTVDIGDSVWWGAYDPQAQEVYFVSQNSNSVYVVNDMTQQLVEKISVGQSPWGITYNPDDGYVYVALLGQGVGQGAGVQIINPANHKVVQMLPIDKDSPRFVAFDSANRRMFVTCGSGDVVVLDSISHKEIDSIRLPDTPYGYYVDQNTGKYVVYSNFTEVLAHASDNDKYGSSPSEIIIVPNNYAYVVHYGVGVISVIDTSSLKIVKLIPTLPVGYGIAYNQADGKIYLSHESLYTISTIPILQKNA